MSKTVPTTIRRLLVGGLPALIAAMFAFPAFAQAAEFGIESFDGSVDADAAGSVYTQAGGHPFSAGTAIRFNAQPDPVLGLNLPVEPVRNIEVDLPPGLVGNPTTTPVLCTSDELLRLPEPNCPIASQVGVVRLNVYGEDRTPIYNMVTADDQPANFAFNYLGVPVSLIPSLRSEGDYGLTLTSRNTPNSLSLSSVEVELWGVPSDPSHDADRYDPKSKTFGIGSDAPRRAFLTNPTACTAPGVGLETRLRANSWLHPETYVSASFFSHEPAPNESQQVGPTGCELVPFAPKAEIAPTASAADQPTGLNTRIEVPQEAITDPASLSSAHVKRVDLQLPEGMVVNPASAAGLDACSQDQIGLDDRDPARCPQASKIGTVEIVTPLLERPLPGFLYLAEQDANPFGSTLALYMTAEAAGIGIKLPGNVSPDPRTGRLRVSFDDNPQLPFSALEVRLKSGPRAPLVTPATCGTYEVRAELTPWSAADPDAPTPEEVASSSTPFAVDGGPDGGACVRKGAAPLPFAPSFSAGLVNPVAGSAGSFLLNLARGDGSQRPTAIEAVLPEGLTAKLAGVPYCAESALAAAAGRSGRAEQASPSCPPASRVGGIVVAAGAGPMPLRVPGQAYLAGPYKGAPLSLAVVTPAVAGPFDLGVVVVRTALFVNESTTQVRAVSDPLPTILKGIPLAIRSLALALDRPDFTRAPTDCTPSRIGAFAFGSEGARTELAERFQVGSCASLAFRPRVNLKLKGKTNRGAYQQLRATLTAKPGQANIDKAAVTMPRSIFLAQEHIETICTRPQFAAGACPEGSAYGKARAFTPLLDQPLEGNVYLRANGGARELPDLVADLKGQIDVELVGYIDSIDGGIRTRFQNVPDAPVSKFVLNMKGGKKSLLTTSRNLCRSDNRATVKLDGQNGRIHDSRPRLKVRCGKKR